MKRYLISASHWDQIKRDFGDSGGIYKLHCYKDGNSDAVIPINRLLGIDPEGVLYIGKTETFHIRVADLTKSLSPEYESEGHNAGRRYSKSLKIQDCFRYENLFVALTAAENPVQAEKIELDEYFQKFGELPPFNERK